MTRWVFGCPSWFFMATIVLDLCSREPWCEGPGGQVVDIHSMVYQGNYHYEDDFGAGWHTESGPAHEALGPDGSLYSTATLYRYVEDDTAMESKVSCLLLYRYLHLHQHLTLNNTYHHCCYNLHNSTWKHRNRRSQIITRLIQLDRYSSPRCNNKTLLSL